MDEAWLRISDLGGRQSDRFTHDESEGRYEVDHSSWEGAVSVMRGHMYNGWFDGSFFLCGDSIFSCERLHANCVDSSTNKERGVYRYLITHRLVRKPKSKFPGVLYKAYYSSLCFRTETSEIKEGGIPLLMIDQ